MESNWNENIKFDFYNNAYNNSDYSFNYFWDNGFSNRKEFNRRNERNKGQRK